MEEEPYDPYEHLIPQEEPKPFDKLFKAEEKFMASRGYSEDEALKTLRKHAVFYIYELTKDENVDAFVPYLAMSYVDRVISRHEIKTVIRDREENKNLFVFCCLTIAWKMRTKSFRVRTFLSNRGIIYEWMSVMRMEFFILNTLEWRMRSLTPICFAEYFIPLLMPRENQNLTRWVVRRIIVKSQADINITQYKPSLVAASVVSNVLSHQFPEQSSSFQEGILGCEFIKEDELSTCKKGLADLCEDMLRRPPPGERTGGASSSRSGEGTSEPPKPAAPESWSSEVGTSEPRRPAAGTSRRASSPIPIGKAAEPPEIIRQEISANLWLASLAPEATIDEETRALILGKMKADEVVLEIEPIQEIQPVQPVEVGIEDELMSFPLEWTDPDAPIVLPLPPPRNFILVMLDNCCPALMDKMRINCNIL